MAQMPLHHSSTSDSFLEHNYGLPHDKLFFSDFDLSILPSCTGAQIPSTYSFPDMGSLPSSSDGFGTHENDSFSESDLLLCTGGLQQVPPPLVKHSMETLLRVMKTWPRALAKGLQAPIILHFTYMCPETMLPPLANCLKVAQMWVTEGEGSSEIVHRTVIREAQAIFEHVSTSSTSFPMRLSNNDYSVDPWTSHIFSLLSKLWSSTSSSSSSQGANKLLFLS